MPITPLHLGPALGIGLPLKRFIHVPTFILANVMLDLEPFIVLVLGLPYPLHGYFHTFLLAIPVGVGLSLFMYSTDKYFQSLYKLLLLENGNKKLKAFVASGVSGTVLHILLDSPLYSDIRPFYPVDVNPLYNPSYASIINDICIFLGLIGLLYYVVLVIYNVKNKLQRTDTNLKK